MAKLNSIRPLRVQQPPKLKNSDHGGPKDQTSVSQRADNAKRVKAYDENCSIGPDGKDYT
jgi:hypothetical protein